MRFKIFYKLLVIGFILFLSNIGVCFGLEDGFGAAQEIEGRHFIIYYAPQVEIPRLIQQLNIRPSDKLLAGKPINEKQSFDAELIDALDTLFMRACDILDMQLYSFQGNIKIYRDYTQLSAIYRNFFDKELEARSFYVADSNTIYISADSFERGIVAHEIAHAIISRYFVVSPSVKIQEVLAGYVEYQLRK